MTPLQKLNKEFLNRHKSSFVSPNWDYSEVQLDGYYTAEDLKRIILDMEEFNKKVNETLEN